MLCDTHVTHAKLSEPPALDSVHTIDAMHVAKCKHAITDLEDQSSPKSHLLVGT